MQKLRAIDNITGLSFETRSITILEADIDRRNLDLELNCFAVQACMSRSIYWVANNQRDKLVNWSVNWLFYLT
jgi:hypothetical protein